MKTNPWTMLFSGNQTDAIGLLRDQQVQSESPLLGLGLAYLWIEDYQSAWEHFSFTHQLEPKTLDRTYILGGVAKWCLGEPREAMEFWRIGCDCDFADAAGGVSAPLLLFAGAVLLKDSSELAAAKKQLTVLAYDSRIQNWPGPIAKLILGEIDIAMLIRLCATDTDRETMALRVWRSDFYLAMTEMERDNIPLCRELLNKIATVPKESIRIDCALFVRQLTGAEFFIARYEDAKTFTV